MNQLILHCFSEVGGILRELPGLREKMPGKNQKTCLKGWGVAEDSWKSNKIIKKQRLVSALPYETLLNVNHTNPKPEQLWLFLVSLSATFRISCAICRQNKIKSPVHFAAGNRFPIQVAQKFWDWLPCLLTGSSSGRLSCLLPVSYCSLRLAFPTVRPLRMRRLAVQMEPPRTCAQGADLTFLRSIPCGSAR